MSYVLDTEDIYLHQDGPVRTVEPANQFRKDKFGEWLERRHFEVWGEAPPLKPAFPKEVTKGTKEGLDMLANAAPTSSG